MHQIRIGAQLHPQHGDYPALRRAAIAAEDLGYDAVFNWDHFFPLYGGGDRHLECWTVLAAWAEATEQIELGPLVTCNSYRNPNLLADMARTVDRISAGRLVLGLGAGWFRRDYDEYGYEFGTWTSRFDALAAALPVIEQRLALLDPPPYRRVPVLIGGVGEQRTLPLAARHATMWHAMFPERPAELRPKIERLHSLCAELGRDPAMIECWVGVEPDDLDRFLDEDADDYLAMGFTGFSLGFNGPDWDPAAGPRWLEWRATHGA
jgi:probable F420-dependent oxidoreductase